MKGIKSVCMLYDADGLFETGQAMLVWMVIVTTELNIVEWKFMRDG